MHIVKTVGGAMGTYLAHTIENLLEDGLVKCLTDKKDTGFLSNAETTRPKCSTKRPSHESSSKAPE